MRVYAQHTIILCFSDRGSCLVRRILVPICSTGYWAFSQNLSQPIWGPLYNLQKHTQSIGQGILSGIATYPVAIPVVFPHIFRIKAALT